MQVILLNINSMRRSNCPMGLTLDVIGDRWTLLIIRDALYKHFKTFGEFKSSSENIASNILSSRLNKLVCAGIFVKNQNETNKLKYDYELTAKGRSLEPLLLALGKWGMDNFSSTDNVLEEIAKRIGAK